MKSSSRSRGPDSFDAAAWLLTGLAVLAAAYAAADSVHWARLAYVNTMSWDPWEFVDRVIRYRAHRESAANLFWTQQNEHRLPFLYLIFCVDMGLFQFRQLFAVACSWLVQSAHAALWCLLFRRAADEETLPSVAFSALMIGLLFSSRQLENLVNIMEATQVAVFFCASLCLWAFGAYARDPRRSPRLLAAAVAAALLACGCLANGLLLWPLLVLMALVERVDRRVAAALAAGGVLVYFLYFLGFSFPPGHANPLQSLRALPGVLGYMGVYLAGPWVFLRPPLAPPLAGAACVLLVAALVALYARFRARPEAARSAFFVWYAVFILGTALLTALGRLNMGLDQAESSRYRTPAFLFWGALAAIACLFLLKHARRPARALIVPVAAAALFAGLVLPRTEPGARTFVRLMWKVRISSIALALDVPDPWAWDYIAHDQPFARADAAFLRERGLSVFAEPAVQAVGKKLDSLFVVAPPGTCEGAVERAQRLPLAGAELAVKVMGTARDARSRAPVDTVLLADDSGTVVGLAFGTPDLSERLAPRPEAASPVWLGYARAPAAARTLRAFGVLASGRDACSLGSVALTK